VHAGPLERLEYAFRSVKPVEKSADQLALRRRRQALGRHSFNGKHKTIVEATAIGFGVRLAALRVILIHFAEFRHGELIRDCCKLCKLASNFLKIQYPAIVGLHKHGMSWI
jgi:hypothetical protein